MWIFSAIANAVGRNFIGSANYLFDILFNRVKADGGVTEAQQCTIDQISYIDKVGLISQASLLVTPTSYKEGKLYADLPTNGNGDFTVTRATTATAVNSAGLVDLVPYNLFNYSEMFSDTLWTKTASSIAINTTIAPNGTLTADTYSVGIDASPQRHRLLQIKGFETGTTYTYSVYLKQNQYQWVQIIGQAAFNTTAWCNFDLQNGVIGNNGGGFETQTITNAGNGWWRIVVTATAISTGNSDIDIVVPTNGTDTGRYPSWQSLSAVDCYYVWGAQLVEGTSARDYLRTETRLNIPRIDYSLGGCPNILLEPQRTNLALQSSSFDSATWLKSSASVTANSTTSPSGIVDADTITTSSTFNNIFQGLSVLASTTYTFSFWALRGTMTDLKYSIYNVSGTSNIIAPTSYYSQTNSSTWTRIIVTFTTPVGCTQINIYPIRDTGVTGTCFLWGAQLEAGAYATSYIPTTTASVTRNADSITRNNIFTNGLITASGGTWFVELRNNRVLTPDTSGQGLSLGDNSNAVLGNQFQIRTITNGRQIIGKRVSGTFTQLFVTTTNTCKISIKWNGSTADIFENGVKVVSATSFTTTALEFITTTISDVSKYINQMALYPTPLTDAQMSMLTSGIYPTAAAAYASLGLVSESPSCLTSTTTF